MVVYALSTEGIQQMRESGERWRAEAILPAVRLKAFYASHSSGPSTAPTSFLNSIRRTTNTPSFQVQTPHLSGCWPEHLKWTRRGSDTSWRRAENWDLIRMSLFLWITANPGISGNTGILPVHTFKTTSKKNGPSKTIWLPVPRSLDQIRWPASLYK